MSIFLEEARLETLDNSDVLSPAASGPKQHGGVRRAVKFSTSIQGTPLKLAGLANAPMFKIKSVYKYDINSNGLNEQQALPKALEPRSSIATQQRFKGNERPKPRFWEHTTPLIPI